MALCDAQVERYSRQIILPEIGGRGQLRLLEATVALAGGGKVWRRAAEYLVAAGVGRLHLRPDGRERGSGSLVERLVDLNPDCEVALAPGVPGGGTARGDDGDVLLCAGDDGELAGRLNGIALSARRPLIVAAARGATGWCGAFAGHLPGEACLLCRPVEAAPPAEAAEELEPAVAGVVGSLLAVFALESILGLDGARLGRLLRYDADTCAFESSRIEKRPGCVACGRREISSAFP